MQLCERVSNALLRAKKSVEAYIVNTLETLIQSESVIADTNDIEQCKSFLRDMPLKSANENNNAREALLRYFDTFSSSSEAPLHALAHALQFAIYTFTYPNNTPSDFLPCFRHKSRFSWTRRKRNKIQKTSYQ